MMLNIWEAALKGSFKYTGDGMVCSHFNFTKITDMSLLTEVDCAALIHCLDLDYNDAIKQTASP